MVEQHNEVAEFLETMKKDAFDQMTKSELEINNKAKKQVEEMIESAGDLDKVKKKFLNKSMYELASDM